MISLASQKLTILIVQNNQIIFDEYQRRLQRLGFIVKHAADSQEAMRFLFYQNFDAVVLDLIIPGGMDGLQLLEKMRQMDRHTTTPVVIFTTVDLSIARVTAHKLGVDYFFNKLRNPFGEVVATLQHITSDKTSTAEPTLRLMATHPTFKHSRKSPVVDSDPFAGEPHRFKPSTEWEKVINELP